VRSAGDRRRARVPSKIPFGSSPPSVKEIEAARIESLVEAASGGKRTRVKEGTDMLGFLAIMVAYVARLSANHNQTILRG
jgi:hypothetical protein